MPDKDKNRRYVTCPSCKGKGHVFDSLSLLFPIFGWLSAIFERNNPSGMSRERCVQCDGYGYIEIPN